MRMETKHSTIQTTVPKSMPQNDTSGIAMKCTKDRIDKATVSATIESSIERREIVMISNKVSQQPDIGDEKSDVTFVLKRQRIENFRKASAFWKDSI